MTIRENATVNVIDGLYKGRTGKVVKIHDFADTAVVSFDDNGDVGKVALSEIVEIQAQADATEIPEGAKKITQDDYNEALSEVMSPERVNVGSVGKFVAAMSTLVVGGRIGAEIFKDRDVVVMTEADFITALWDACSPAKIAEYSGRNGSDRATIHVSITTMIGLEEIVGILFGADNG